jgi:DNA-binding transcriptional LysR family regulator
MDVDQLAVLREVGDRGSVTAAAVALHKSPSAVSQQLRTLQRHVGEALVERVGRGIRLTDAGRTLAQSAVRVATAMAEAEAALEARRAAPVGRVSMAMYPSAAELFVPGLLARMTAHPSIDLDFADEDISQDAFPSRTADYDLVVAHRSDEAEPTGRERLRVVPLLREPLDVAVPLEHPLASAASVSVDDLAAEKWISVPEGFPLDRALVAMAVRAGHPLNVVFRSVHLPLIENLVAAGMGVAIVPRHSSRARAAGRFALLPLADVRAGRRIEVLARADRLARRAVRTVLDELVAVAERSDET